MATPQITQEEYRAYLAAGKTHIWAYKTLYVIAQKDDGTYYLRKIGRSVGHMGVVPRGRFAAMAESAALKFLPG